MLQTLRGRRTAWLASRLAALSPDELAQVAAAVAPLQRLASQEESGA
jgi:hypothetical protein